MLRLGILCGGKSGEHEVSLLSAQGIYAAVERERFDPVLVTIDKTGAWRAGTPEELLLHADDPSSIAINPDLPELVPMAGSGHCLLSTRAGNEMRHKIDVFFPIIHGTDGEDGALQGMLRMLDVPFVGADVLGSAVGMDKDVMKRLLVHAGLPVARWVTVRSVDEGLRLFGELKEKWSLPLFIKPTALGSSVGVSRVDEQGDMEPALAEAFRYDQRVLIEEAISGREIECSVLGNPGGAEPLQASRTGEILASHAFYSYDAKYLDPEGAKLSLPAEIEPVQEEQIRELAIQTFDTLDCAGLARVDFFLQESGKIYINEINTLPGFTKISMYAKLWDISGLPYPKLITRLVELGLERYRQRAGLTREFIPMG